MKKRNKKLIQEKAFNDYAAAQTEVEICQRRVTRILIGLVIAVIATVLTCVGISKGVQSDSGLIFLVCAFLLAIPAYLIGGGLGRALKAAKNLGVWGWILTPFPFDIVTGLLTLFIAFFGFFFFPVIFVLMNYSQNSADLRAAKRYLSHCKPAEVKE